MFRVSSTHRLSAKGSRDASLGVESTRAWRFYAPVACACAGCATPGPCNAQHNAFGWASGVARPRVARAI